MEFITENWTGIGALVVALHGVALAVVNLTPTPKDNDALSKVYGYVEKLAGLFTTKVKS